MGFVYMHASVYLIPACSLVMCGVGVVIFHCISVSGCGHYSLAVCEGVVIVLCEGCGHCSLVVCGGCSLVVCGECVIIVH